MTEWNFIFNLVRSNTSASTSFGHKIDDGRFVIRFGAIIAKKRTQRRVATTQRFQIDRCASVFAPASRDHYASVQRAFQKRRLVVAVILCCVGERVFRVFRSNVSSKFLCSRSLLPPKKCRWMSEAWRNVRSRLKMWIRTRIAELNNSWPEVNLTGVSYYHDRLFSFPYSPFWLRRPRPRAASVPRTPFSYGHNLEITGKRQYDEVRIRRTIDTVVIFRELLFISND